MKFFKEYSLMSAILILITITSIEIPLWVGTVSLLLLGWRFLIESYSFAKPNGSIVSIFGVVLLAGVYIQYRSLLGQEESGVIAVGITTLTILNFSTRRDQFFLVLLGFLLIAIKSMYSVELYWSLPLLLAFILLWLGLLKNNNYKLLLKVFLYSLPLAIALFIFFPRWVIFKTQQPQANIGVSGFIDEVKPGFFSQIVLKDQTVFRVEFLSQEVSTQDLYWRGAVLTESNGLNWKHAGVLKAAQSMQTSSNAGGINYKLTLEPSNVRNIFLMENPIKITNSTALFNEVESKTFKLSMISKKSVQIEAVSSLENRVAEKLNADATSNYLKIAPLPPKTFDWVQDVSQKFSEKEKRLGLLRAFFRDGGFAYTLQGGETKNDLDYFLFTGKKGFCEHFAASFATLARALDIPARLIVGYQGGRLNVLGDYWRISQKDAHAWVEVYMNGSWQREDPTELVSPLRIAIGGERFFSLSEFELDQYAKNRNAEIVQNAYSVWLHVSSLIDQLNYNWTLFLLSYDLETQMSYLNSVKGGGMIFLIFGLFSMFMLFFIYQRRKQNALNHENEFTQLVFEIEKWAEGRKISVAANSSPIELFKFVEVNYPQTRLIIEKISQNYIKFNYMPTLLDSSQKTRAMQEAARELRREWKKSVKSLDL